MHEFPFKYLDNLDTVKPKIIYIPGVDLDLKYFFIQPKRLFVMGYENGQNIRIIFSQKKHD